MKKLLIYAYGNPGRQDDGLGNAFIELMEPWAKDNGYENVSFDSNYQLNIEDAAEIADKDLVVFVDASVEDIDDYILTKVDEKSEVAFTTHAATPGYIVKLCRDIFNKTPETFLLHIKGYEWAFKEGLTDKAKENLHKALEFLQNWIVDQTTS